jgi:regulator of replication initiation timing
MVGSVLAERLDTRLAEIRSHLAELRTEKDHLRIEREALEAILRDRPPARREE